LNLQDELFTTYNAIVRASPASREQLLEFFAEVLRRNVKRSGMRVDHRTVASDGYMLNMQGMLLRLFEPVMDVTYSKVSCSKPQSRTGREELIFNVTFT
jgi:ubiquitin conjugation factor E4 B